MRVRRFHITQALIEEIAVRVQSGAFPHVAAEAAGVPAEVFQEWMERGSRPGAREPYRGLAEQVRHAHGHARCVSEVALRQKDPKAWLPFVGARHPSRREHRTVVLPDYQGVGIGNALSALVASLWKGLGCRAVSTTTHPALIRARLRSPLWRLRPLGRVPSPGNRLPRWLRLRVGVRMRSARRR